MMDFKDKTVLVTGHTGFKGSWLSLWLHKMGAKVAGISLDIPSEQPIVRRSYLEQLGRFDEISTVSGVIYY